MTDATPLASEQITQEADELEALIGKATDCDLADEGRYFSETCNDLTSCRHGETGEYNDQHDGPLVEFLWNHRHHYLSLLRSAALSATPAPSDQDASRAQGEVERVARAICQSRDLSPDTLYQHNFEGDWPEDDRREYTDPFTGEPRVMLFHRAWRRWEKAAAAAISTLSPAPGATAQDGVERTASQCSVQEVELAALLAEVELELRHCRVFISSREKMHPSGIELYDQLHAKVNAALDGLR